jgi:hypothetical protein
MSGLLVIPFIPFSKDKIGARREKNKRFVLGINHGRRRFNRRFPWDPRRMMNRLGRLGHSSFILYTVPKSIQGGVP